MVELSILIVTNSRVYPVYPHVPQLKITRKYNKPWGSKTGKVRRKTSLKLTIVIFIIYLPFVLVGVIFSSIRVCPADPTFPDLKKRPSMEPKCAEVGKRVYS